MKYSPNWNLHSIPAAEIPEDLLKSWWASYTSGKRARKKTATKKEREWLDKKAASMARLRAERKAGIVSSTPRRKKAGAQYSTT